MEWIPLKDEESQILFHSQEIDFELQDQDKYQSWVNLIISKEQKRSSNINYIFCNDSYLLEKNQSYLQHDTLTDIITFEYQSDPISGDIFISIDRVKENALERDLPFQEELHRVMAHGILHLCGYGDKKEEEIKEMRAKEEQYMRLVS